MKRRVIAPQKKGSIELSMTTIIVVVLGITILTLGLRWVQNIFGGLEENRVELIEATQQQIRETFGESSEPLNLLSSAVSVKIGEFKDVGVGLMNVYSEPHAFSYAIQVQDYPPSTTSEAVISWVLWNRGTVQLASGQLYTDTISLDPKMAPLGVYKFVLTLTCQDCPGADVYSAPLTVRIVAK